MRASSCVFAGKWMYEVTLETAGIQQIGWATIDTPFTNEVFKISHSFFFQLVIHEIQAGVGDSLDSYSYDGKRQSKWNAAKTKYGQVGNHSFFLIFFCKILIVILQ
jgi:Kip1 ubiquitination-promoting complex protein 1